MKYLQTLVKIPVLDPDPPSFLLPGQLIERELARQVKLAAQVDEEASISSLIEPAEVEPPPTLAATATPTASVTSSVFDSQFGSGFGEGYDFNAPRSPVKTRDERLVCVYMLYALGWWGGGQGAYS